MTETAQIRNNGTSLTEEQIKRFHDITGTKRPKHERDITRETVSRRFVFATRNLKSLSSMLQRLKFDYKNEKRALVKELLKEQMMGVVKVKRRERRRLRELKDLLEDLGIWGRSYTQKMKVVE